MQPIALPEEPASFSKQFLGTPISWKPGSFGGRLYGSPGQPWGLLDPSDFKCGKISSSIESDRGSVHSFERQDELCRNYSCCGQTLTDMHALVDHFEEVHIYPMHAYSHVYPHLYPDPSSSTLPTPLPLPATVFEPEDMELDSDTPPPPSHSPSPPDTPITTPQTQSLYPHALLPFPHSQSTPTSPHTRALNAYAGYSDYSSGMPGTVPSPPGYDDESEVHVKKEEGTCVTPAALFGGIGLSRTQPPTPAASPSPRPRQSALSAPSTTLSRPASTLLLSKPFPCPKPNCNKSYKQANGLKYHTTHGSCSLKPVREVEAVKVLLASKSKEEKVEVTQDDLLMLEKRIRPFACGIGDCQRRYKNMNGLRYHYSHSGDHGRKGLDLLARGVHECLANSNGRGSRGGSRAVTPAPTAGYEGGVTLHPTTATTQVTPSAPTTQYGYAGMAYPRPQPQPTPTFTPFQTTSYTLAGAMGPPSSR